MEDLARLSIKNKPVYVGVDDAEQESTVDGLEQVTNSLLLHRPCLDCLDDWTDQFDEGSVINEFIPPP